MQLRIGPALICSDAGVTMWSAGFAATGSEKTMRNLAMLALLTLSGGVVASDDAGHAAEYAFRWEAVSGLSQMTEVLEALNLQPKDGKAKTKTFEVRYLTIKSGAKLPMGYARIGRERTGPDEKEATFKVRGPEPIPHEFATWSCPLKGSSKAKKEFDVSLTGEATPKRTFSVSCTAEGTALAPALLPGYEVTPVQCKSTMERSSIKPVKVERWTLPSGRVVFEVSMDGIDAPKDLSTFKGHVKKLTGKGAVPLKQGMTELGSQC